MPESPLVYLILGASGSGRREVVADLIDGGEIESGRSAVMLAEGETPAPADENHAPVFRWRWTSGQMIDGALPENADPVFFFAHGRLNPVDQLEAFKPWLDAQGGGLGRIICVVNCQLAERHPALLRWYDACVHFSDVVLLNRREGVSQKWIGEFEARFRGQFFPCVIEIVKGGRVRNPALILEPQALRISHAFDDEVDWETVEGGDEAVDEEEADEVEMQPAEDPYFARNAAGRRIKEIPPIEKYLSKQTAESL